MASWYGEPFHGRLTASGSVYDMNQLTAAHKTLPFGTVLHVKNLLNGKTVEVTVTDRGPFVENRVLDLSKAAALQLDMINSGVVPIEWTIVNSNISPIQQVKGDIYQIAAFTNFLSAKDLHEALVSKGLDSKVFKFKKLHRVVVVLGSDSSEILDFLKIMDDLGIRKPLKKSSLPEGDQILSR